MPMRVEIKITAGPAKGQVFVFEEPDRFLFGRAADARVSLPNDPYVSRQHFLLEISPPECRVTDLESKNGLFVNGIRYGGKKSPRPDVAQAPNGVQTTYLNDGDEVVVGDTRMKVVIQTDLFCVECGKKIPPADKDEFLFVGNTYLCGSCRQEHVAARRAPANIAPPIEIADSGKYVVHCIRCQRDVTEEAGARGQIPGAAYVCKVCREKEAVSPLELIEKMLNAAVVQKAPDGSPTIQGYHIEKKIARGGMGVVYKATEQRTGRPVAIKTMLPHVAANPDGVRTFQREIEVNRQLTHPNIVQLIEHGNAQGTFYLVLEFIDGTDLYQLIKSKGGRLELREAAPLILQTLAGLAYAHQAALQMEIADGQIKTFTGVVHRDLKPQNILLARQGTQWTPKIADFGTAKSFESAGLTDMTVPGDVLGTPMYWPREQITHYKYLTPATDVFSIAAVFYEALTGVWVREGFEEMFARCKQQKRAPSISDYMKVIAGNPTIPIRKRNPDLPEAVASVLDRALREAEVPHDETKMREILAKLRYPDAWMFREELARALKDSGLTELLPRRNGATMPKAPAVKPESPHRPIAALLQPPADAAMMYSIMPPSSSREVALFVLDLEKSSQYIQEVGDTHFSNFIGSIYKRIKNHYLASDLIFLKTTGDGFLAVFHKVETAFLIATEFLNTLSQREVSLRMALHWGMVKTGPDGDVLGAEVHRVFRIENVQAQDQSAPQEQAAPLPASGRILATNQVMQQLRELDRTRFEFAGRFRLKGFDEPCELWLFSCQT